MHSLLFVPAKERMLQKIGMFQADAYILDLEDSIQESEKELALNAIIKYLSEDDLNNVKVIVRVNKLNARKEIEQLLPFSVGFMLPKYETGEDYAYIQDLVKGRTVIALIETPRAFINLASIVSIDYIMGLAFGAEDYTANIGMENNIELLQFQKSQIVTYAKAYRKLVYDTPSFVLENEDLFRTEVDNSKALGFDGKLAINPRHIDYINYKWNDVDVESMRSIIEKYEASGEAVISINGKVYERMHIAHMKRIIKENARF